MTRRKKWQDLTIADDYMFKLVMGYPHICKRLVEKVLGISVREIKYLERERIFKNTYDGKGIRLDVYVEDEARSRFVLEMQVRDYGLPEIGRRSRFYQSSIDFDFLAAGEKYKAMGDAAVIFFCPFPLFDGKRRMYTFRNTCQEDKNLLLQDGMTKVFLSSAGHPADGLDPDVAAFLDYMNGNMLENAFVKEIDDKIRRMKSDRGKETDYMTFQMILDEEREEAREEGREEGRKEGREEGCEGIVVNMLRKNMPFQEIVDLCGMTADAIRRIAKKNGIAVNA